MGEHAGVGGEAGAKAGDASRGQRAPMADGGAERSALNPRLTRLFGGLGADATRFDFYYTLRHVDAYIDGDVPLGRAPRARDEPLRLTQHPSLIFAPSTLYQYKEGVAAHGLGRLAVHHFGLFGPNGALPQHITEYVQERILHYKDETFARFADIFQHRMILLFYRAWADSQSVTSLDNPGRDHFGRYIGSLIGLGQPSLRNRDSVPDHLKLHHAGHLARQTRNPEGLVRALSALLRVPVTLGEFCMQWLRLAPSERTCLVSVASAGDGGQHRIELGSASSRLGMGAVAGSRVPDVQNKFRLRIGPMPLAEFERYLPGGERFVQVRDWIRNYIGVETAWDMQLVLQRSQVPPAQLGVTGRLGWTSWLGMPAARRKIDADDVILDAERLTEQAPA
ncbi:MAG: type VI secretion system baseplate subunit TssG [Burkholderiales bacterium]|nr:type VI secretion system baseplate subunit TssG [Burkholderiales bacterium]